MSPGTLSRQGDNLCWKRPYIHNLMIRLSLILCWGGFCNLNFFTKPLECREQNNFQVLRFWATFISIFDLYIIFFIIIKILNTIPFIIGSGWFNLLHSNRHSLVMPGPIFKLFTFLENWDHFLSLELWTIHMGLV